ncbi:UNVERIFIED_CONTAM: hypothetical protein Scaly_2426300 [Sesamum calycinum]|uniref:Uncharacterized protein n=1 Tax=Sesamum calycinum TaxID=2727403 RepID=A0AAW2M0R1_9LAMI
MIQGFNQGGQKAFDIIRMQLTMEEMVLTTLFLVIDAKTSYNMFLSSPWLHEKAVVPSIWHQCFKYYRNSVVKRVLGDNKPFSEAESHFVDAKYYIEDIKKAIEVLPSEEPKPSGIPSTRKNGSSAIKVELSTELTVQLTQINSKETIQATTQGICTLNPIRGRRRIHSIGYR